jgi:hypothetical protein
MVIEATNVPWQYGNCSARLKSGCFLVGIDRTFVAPHTMKMTNEKKTGSGTWVEGTLGQATEMVHAGVNPDSR